MADPSKIAGGLRKALEAASAAKKVPQAPSIIVPSKISELKKIVQEQMGGYGAKRLERAADEIPDLDKLYSSAALKSAFVGDNARALMTMNPKDFEKYAAPIPKGMSGPQAYRGYGSQFLDDSMKDMTLKEYIESLTNVPGGFADVPFLEINKKEQGLPLMPFISGHEGRHRSRALVSQGQEANLVRLLPRAELREPFPRRSQEEYIEALKKELEMTGNKVVPQKYEDIIRRAIELPDIYAKGGKVLHKVDGGKITGGLRKALEAATARGGIRMAAGGDSIKPTPRHKGLGAAADVVNFLHRAASKPFGYNNPPVELLSELLGVPAVGRTLDRMSYGEPLTNYGKANKPLLPDDIADATMSVAPLVGPLSKMATKGAKAVGKGALDLAKSDAAYNLAQKTFASPMMAAARPMGVVKEPGGNWRSGFNGPEKSLEKLRRKTAGGMEPSDALSQMRQTYPIETTHPDLLRQHEPIIANLQNDVAVNKWIDSNLKNYLKKQMGTVDDPIRKLGEEGITHLPDNEIANANALWKPGSHRERQGYPFEGFGKSEIAQGWEKLSDASISIDSAKDYIKELKLNDKMYNELTSGRAKNNSVPEWLEKTSPETPIYSAKDNAYRSLGFDHVLDVLKEDVAAGRIRPEQLNKVSMEQAVRRTYEYDQEMAKKMREAAIKQTEGMPVHKEYPGGYKWIELKSGDDAKTTADALKYEGDTMGHCVGNYCPDVMEGKSRIYSLRDVKGEPHVTVEIKPQTSAGWEDFKKAGSDPLLAHEESKRRMGITPENETAYLKNMPYEERDKANNELSRHMTDIYKEQYGELPQSIQQIKGKQNRAPHEQYQPYVQDFVKSGKWSDVGDLENAGLYSTKNFNGIDPENGISRSRNAKTLALGRARAAGELPEYVTPAEYEAIIQKHAPEDIWSHGGEVHMAGGGKMIKGIMGALSKVQEGSQSDQAAKAIGKAAESAGMNAPVTANKPLTGLQDFHTSLQDQIRQHVADKKEMIESMPFKYDKGHRVFTEGSAAKNKPPYTIMGRYPVGNNPVREGPGLGKVVRDPDTGKAKRTPYEPGYMVRHEDGDEWAEFMIPESKIKGQVERKGGVIHMGGGGKIVGGLRKALAAAAKAEEKPLQGNLIEKILEAQQPPMTTPMGTGLPLMPRDQGMYTPRQQKELPRMVEVDKARAANKSPKYNERMQDLLDSPTARKKVDKLIDKGQALNIKEWYGTEPLRQVAMDLGRTPEQFESMLAQLASASQRNPVDKQNQMGSYLYHLSETGQLPENSLLLTNKLKKALKEDPSLAEGRQLVELPQGYGSLAQGDIFNRAVMIGQGNIGKALPPEKKLGTFYENLLGNLKPVTVDVNALRGPIIERGDPRWLTSKLVEKDDTGKVINTYKPREMYASGELSMREARQRPGFWEAAPSGSEYAGFEDLWTRGAKRHGVEPAEAQALGWYGSGVAGEGQHVTALKTKPELYVDNLERLIKKTAEQTGKSPTEVMNDMITGQGFLRKDGGAVTDPHKSFEEHRIRTGHEWVGKEVKKADGGLAFKTLNFKSSGGMAVC